MKSIQNLSLIGIGHSRLKSIRVNDVIPLALANTFARPIERVLPPPDQGTDQAFIETQFLPKFPPQPFFNPFARFKTTTRSDPKPLHCAWLMDSEQKNFVLRRKENGTNCLS